MKTECRFIKIEYNKGGFTNAEGSEFYINCSDNRLVYFSFYGSQYLNYAFMPVFLIGEDTQETIIDKIKKYTIEGGKYKIREGSVNIIEDRKVFMHGLSKHKI